MEVGTVISTETSPSTSEVVFLAKERVERGQFVEIEYDGGVLIGLVTEVQKTNRYYESPETVKEYEREGKSLREIFPVEEWEYLVGIVKPLAYERKGLERPTYPPSPGTPVRLADPQRLKRFLGLTEDGLNLGTVFHHDIPLKVSLTRLLQKHVAILAMSGAGKSYLTSVLIEELLLRKKEQGRIAVVVFDVHGEYLGFNQPSEPDFSEKTLVIPGKDVRIGVPLLDVNLMVEFLPNLSSIQVRELSQVISELRKEMREGSGPYGLEILEQRIVEKEMKESTKKALLSWIETLKKTGLFAPVEYPTVFDALKPGQLTIFDLSSLIDIRERQMVVAYFLRRFFSARRRKTVPPFLSIIEEAHQFVPEGAERSEAISRGIIETVAREGRKFGASLCLISQRPIRLSTTALSQCNTHIILRMTNPYDIEHVAKSSEGIDRRSKDMITSLRTGEALMVGSAVNFPVFFKVRERISPESPHEIPLEEMAKRYEEEYLKEKDDLEAFI